MAKCLSFLGIILLSFTIFLSLTSAQRIVYRFDYEIDETDTQWILIEHQPAGDWRFYYSKDKFTYADIQQIQRERDAAMREELRILADQGRPVTEGTPSRVGGMATNAIRAEFDTSADDPFSDAVGNFLEPLSYDTLLTSGVILLVTVMAMLALGIKSWIGWVMGIAAASAITYIVVGGFSLILSAGLIVFIIAYNTLGVRS